MAHLEIYKSPSELLDAISPHLLPTREWQSNRVIGLNLERNEPDPLDYYAAVWVRGQLQIALFCFHKTPINLTPCREVYDMQHFQSQLELLAEYITSQPKEVLDSYELVIGPGELTRPLVPLIAQALNRELELLATIRGSYVDKMKFMPHSPPDSTHVIRQANVQDDIPAMAALVRVFQLNAPILGHPMPLQELIDVLPRPVERGLYYIYVLPDGTISALAMVRRPTPTGISIVMVVTAEEHRKKGYATALTSWVIQNAFDPIEMGGRGRDHLCIFWLDGGDAGKIYKKLGFVEGYVRLEWKFKDKRL